MKKYKKFKLDYNTKYDQDINIKPEGFWYQFCDCFQKWKNTNEITNVKFGKYIYQVDLKPNSLTYLDKKSDKNKILVLSNIEEVLKFSRKYGKSVSSKLRLIDWEKVSLLFGGIEIKNFNKIKTEMWKLKVVDRIAWVSSFDFSSGCVWNLDIIKDVKKI